MKWAGGACCSQGRNPCYCCTQHGRRIPQPARSPRPQHATNEKPSLPSHLHRASHTQVAYINIKQWLDARQEKEDRDKEKAAPAAAASSSAAKWVTRKRLR